VRDLRELSKLIGVALLVALAVFLVPMILFLAVMYGLGHGAPGQ
jgi:hypothetical protein